MTPATAMAVAATVEQARAAVGVLPRPLGFVPTMGALHPGHLALVAAARAECASVVASVFVNPAQFGPGEDFERYPRDYAGDRAKLEHAGASLLFAPESGAIYPPGYSTVVDVGPMGARYEGAVRPTHFRGVATVVSKLLNVVRPDVLYVGQKDAQQTAVLRKMVRDLDVPVRVQIVPTVREDDGVALSSRNVYLTAEQRAAAPTLHAMLRAFLGRLREGASGEAAAREARPVLSPLAQLDYLDLVDADTFEPLAALRSPAFAIAAVR
ncbi:MAG: pantoate--beta-alanine ligase, partial [Vulcanimicrobiaceae bacterium]